MTTINRALLKAYERQPHTDAGEQAEHNRTAPLRGWAAKLRKPIRATELPTVHEEPAIAAASADVVVSWVPVAMTPAEPARPDQPSSDPAVNLPHSDGTNWRFDQPHPTSQAAQSSEHEEASTSVATVYHTGWTWPTIVERLLTCPAANEFRQFASDLHTLATECDLRCVAFSGTGHHAGRTSLIATLARVLSEEKSARIALVDAHFGEPGLGQILSLELASGLGEVIRESNRDPLEAITSLSSQLAIAPLRERVLAEAVDRRTIGQMQSLLRLLRCDYDLVLIDAGPWEAAGPPRVLDCRAVDAFVSVSRSRSATGTEIGEQHLTQLGIEWLGQIETFVPAPSV
jgi:Mrp family chromosome partitioning ATPase